MLLFLLFSLHVLVTEYAFLLAETAFCFLCYRKGTNVLAILDRLATYALNLTGIFYCQLSSDGFQNQNPSTLEWVSKFTNCFSLLCCFLSSYYSSPLSLPLTRLWFLLVFIAGAPLVNVLLMIFPAKMRLHQIQRWRTVMTIKMQRRITSRTQPPCFRKESWGPTA